MADNHPDRTREESRVPVFPHYLLAAVTGAGGLFCLAACSVFWKRARQDAVVDLQLHAHEHAVRLANSRAKVTKAGGDPDATDVRPQESLDVELIRQLVAQFLA